MEKQDNLKENNKYLNCLILTSIISIIVVVSKYIGLIKIVEKIISAFTPIFLAIFISIIMEPLISFFQKKKIKRKYSVIISYLIVVIILGVILYYSLPTLIDQLKIFIGVLPNLVNTFASWLNKLGLDISFDNLTSTFTTFLINMSKQLLDSLSSIITTLINLFLAISGALFLSFDLFSFKEKIKRSIPVKIRKPVIFYFSKYLPFLNKYFLGMLIDSVLIFLISMIGFSFIKLDYILVVSLFIAITNLIPYIGPYIGGAFATIIGFSVSYSLGISALIVSIIVQILESNFIQPLILKNVISLHPLEGILGISVFGNLFGIVGMVLSPILMVAIKLLFIPYEE